MLVYSPESFINYVSISTEKIHCIKFEINIKEMKREEKGIKPRVIVRGMGFEPTHHF